MVNILLFELECRCGDGELVVIARLQSEEELWQGRAGEKKNRDQNAGAAIQNDLAVGVESEVFIIGKRGGCRPLGSILF